MKIAIMMRAIDQGGGLAVYTERLTEGMLRIDRENTYLLMYRTNDWLGRFSSYANVTEVLLRAPNKLAWDQLAVPFKAWRERADIIFNPKFSVPFISHCPVAMSLREPAWWTWPEHYPRWNYHFMKATIPRYCQRSAALFPISDFVLDECQKFLSLPESKISVAYPAPNHHFRRITDAAVLEQFREKYRLPEKFILTVTRVDHPGIENSEAFFPGKNVETTVRAFARCRGKIPHKLVIAGRRVREYLVHVGVSEDELEDVYFMDFVPHEELAALYSLAELFVIPSFYESYAHALVEAMACGCPVIASRTGACPEITNGAALLADPYDPADFAEKILTVLSDTGLARELARRGKERAAFFSWERTARTVLNGLSGAVEKSRRHAPQM